MALAEVDKTVVESAGRAMAAVETASRALLAAVVRAEKVVASGVGRVVVTVMVEAVEVKGEVMAAAVRLEEATVAVTAMVAVLAEDLDLEDGAASVVAHRNTRAYRIGRHSKSPNLQTKVMFHGCSEKCNQCN
jgi:hypothetical protein